MIKGHFEGTAQTTGLENTSANILTPYVISPGHTPSKPKGLGERFRNTLRGIPPSNLLNDLELSSSGARSVIVLRTGFGLNGNMDGFLFHNLYHAAGAAFPDLVERILTTSDTRLQNALRNQILSTYRKIFMHLASYISPLSEFPKQTNHITRAEILRLRITLFGVGFP
jgi:hypothetical protein